MSISKLLLGAFAALTLPACGNGGGSPSSSSNAGSAYESYQQASDPATILTKKCAAEAGIPANDPQHRISPEEMNRLTACVDRNR